MTEIVYCPGCRKSMDKTETKSYGLCFDCGTRESLNDEEYYGENRYRKDETE